MEGQVVIKYHSRLTVILTGLLAVLSQFANPSIVQAVGFDLKLDVTEFAKIAWNMWTSASSDAKAAVPVNDLIREMNLLVGQREAFLPRFEDYVAGETRDPGLPIRLRAEALDMMSIAQRIQNMLRKLDPTFSATHSEVHIQSTGVATSRAAKAEETVRVFDSRGALIDRRDLIRRLRTGTCDLWQVIHNIRVASGQQPEPLSARDKECGVK